MNEISYTFETLPIKAENLITLYEDSTIASFIPKEGEENTLYTYVLLSEDGTQLFAEPKITFTPFEGARIKKIYYPNGIDIFFHSNEHATIDTKTLQDKFVEQIKLKDPTVNAMQENTYVFLNQAVFRLFGFPNYHCAILLYSGVQRVSEIITPEAILDCFRQVVQENFN